MSRLHDGTERTIYYPQSPLLSDPYRSASPILYQVTTMKKLMLDVEALVVDSFGTSAGVAEGLGTVRGRDSNTGPEPPDTIVATCDCPPPNTGGSCAGTCGWSCGTGCTAVTCGEYTCAQTCPDSCYVCGTQGPVG